MGLIFIIQAQDNDLSDTVDLNLRSFTAVLQDPDPFILAWRIWIGRKAGIRICILQR